MNYVILLKTVLDENCVHNEIKKIAHDGEIELDKMYELCECSCIDIKEIQFDITEHSGNLFIIPRVTAIFDDEFLLSGKDLYANQLASILYGYLDHGECLCGNVLLCWTNDDGECQPFCEEEANEIVKLLCVINNHIDDVEFKVHQPMLIYREF